MRASGTDRIAAIVPSPRHHREHGVILGWGVGVSRGTEIESGEVCDACGDDGCEKKLNTKGNGG